MVSLVHVTNNHICIPMKWKLVCPRYVNTKWVIYGVLDESKFQCQFHSDSLVENSYHVQPGCIIGPYFMKSGAVPLCVYIDY
jgi:hypothetical protein